MTCFRFAAWFTALTNPDPRMHCDSSEQVENEKKPLAAAFIFTTTK